MNPGIVQALVGAFAAGAIGWGTAVVRLMWQFREELTRIGDRLGELSRVDSEIQQRLDRHLAWHERIATSRARRHWLASREG